MSTTSPSDPLPTRLYLETLLQRSRTTYNTLMVTLYYLTLPGSTALESTCEADSSRHAKMLTPLHCQRRLFLSALMLAWKFTQERCYSSAHWAAMSGLCLKEINMNEATFLSTVHWDLYISGTAFEQWGNEVASYIALPELMLRASVLRRGCNNPARNVPFPLCSLPCVPTEDLNNKESSSTA
ncbi:hypothetical protein GQ53DRAFT_740442 [Thozetella sp. PMI_491]|nr:hypothetical protein GQ53DRAFT_740442 [Thozetella sp. PMI_491]